MKFFILVYSFIWTIALPLVKSMKRIKFGLDERLGKADYQVQKRQNKKRVIIYTASGGEAFLACKYLEKNYEEDTFYYCFSWTKEGVNTFQSFSASHANFELAAYYTPFDSPSIIYKALQEISPSACIILETEIWFGLLYACKRLSIPFSFVNARMTEKTYNRLSYFKFLFHQLSPTMVYALTHGDVERFKNLFSLKDDTVKIIENLKFEQARELVKELAYTEIVNIKIPVVFFASIRKEEEKLILESIKKIRSEFPNICIMVCPKHIERGAFWIENIPGDVVSTSQYKLISQNWSSFIDKGYKNFVWDSYGHLRKLYRNADISYVGGSLTPNGGQNFLEPLAAGCVPYVGKYIDNFEWVFVREPNLKDINLLKQVSSVDELTASIIDELKNFIFEDRAENKINTFNSFKKWLE